MYRKFQKVVLGLLLHVTPSNFLRRILRSEALVYKSYFFQNRKKRIWKLRKEQVTLFYNHLQKSTLGFACPFSPGTGCQTTATDMRHMTKVFIDFMYVLFMQIFKWCNYVKMTGLMKSTLPFELPLNVDKSSAKSVIRMSSFFAMKTSGTWNMCIERRCQSCRLFLSCSKWSKKKVARIVD